MDKQERLNEFVRNIEEYNIYQTKVLSDKKAEQEKNRIAKVAELNKIGNEQTQAFKLELDKLLTQQEKARSKIDNEIISLTEQVKLYHDKIKPQVDLINANISKLESELNSIKLTDSELISLKEESHNPSIEITKYRERANSINISIDTLRSRLTSLTKSSEIMMLEAKIEALNAEKLRTRDEIEVEFLQYETKINKLKSDYIEQQRELGRIESRITEDDSREYEALLIELKKGIRKIIKEYSNYIN